MGNTVAPELTVLCCTHGDEPFGATVFGVLRSDTHRYPGLLIVLANEEALRLGQRQVDSNLNRVYPGRPDGDTEERLAHQITQLMRNSRWMIDVHTTRSQLRLAPIISKFNPAVEQILSYTSARHIFRMPELSNNAGTATIDQVAAGVGLEFGRDYAEKPAALRDVRRVVSGLLEGKKSTPRTREIHRYAGVIPMDFSLPGSAKNFCPMPFNGRNVIPFLISDGNYDDENHRGFYSEDSVSIVI